MKNKRIIICSVILCLIAIIVVIFVLVFAKKSPLAGPRGIDCMPPMSADEQKCLDSGECVCETY